MSESFFNTVNSMASARFVGTPTAATTPWSKTTGRFPASSTSGHGTDAFYSVTPNMMAAPAAMKPWQSGPRCARWALLGTASVLRAAKYRYSQHSAAAPNPTVANQLTAATQPSSDAVPDICGFDISIPAICMPGDPAMTWSAW